MADINFSSTKSGIKVETTTTGRSLPLKIQQLPFLKLQWANQEAFLRSTSLSNRLHMEKRIKMMITSYRSSERIKIKINFPCLDSQNKNESTIGHVKVWKGIPSKRKKIINKKVNKNSEIRGKSCMTSTLNKKLFKIITIFTNINKIKRKSWKFKNLERNFIKDHSLKEWCFWP